MASIRFVQKLFSAALLFGCLLLGSACRQNDDEPPAEPTINRPFPQHVAYTPGTIKPNHLSQAALDTAVKDFYDQWQGRYLKAGCEPNHYYIYYNYEQGSEPSNAICVSEGQGYGMLLTAFMAGYDSRAKTFFDGLYRYFKAHPSLSSAYLMAWQQVAPDCRNTPNDGDSSATDGDLDIAYALLLADKQWGSAGEINYRQEALHMIQAIMDFEVSRKLWTLELGDWVDSNDPTYASGTRPSDFTFDHLKAFQAASGETAWGNLLNGLYGICQSFSKKFSPATGLLSDFIVIRKGSPEPAPEFYLEDKTDGCYSWNACRTPWRLGLDYLLSGETRLLSQLRKMNKWIRQVSSENPRQILAGYRLDGTPLPDIDYSSLAFTAPFAVSAMIDAANQEWLNRLWDTIIATTLQEDDYYGNSLKLLVMIAVSGNWWQPL